MIASSVSISLKSGDLYDMSPKLSLRINLVKLCDILANYDAFLSNSDGFS
jgi:hypothetical protein